LTLQQTDFAVKPQLNCRVGSLGRELNFPPMAVTCAAIDQAPQPQDGSLYEITSASIPYNSPQGLTGF
jgi:hypothetical protein